MVRQLDDDVVARLKARAKRHGRSMEDEVRHILRGAVTGDRRPSVPFGTRLAARFRSLGLTEDLPELRGRQVLPPDLER